MHKIINLFWQKDDQPVGRAVMIVNIGLASLLFFLFFYITFIRLTYDFHWDSVWKYRSKFLQGFLVTVELSIVSLGLSLVIGTILAAGQRTKILPLRMLSRMIIEIIRGTPFLVQILVFFYVVADAFGFENRFLVGAIILSLFSGAYISEMIRAGIESVGSSQIESARSLGMTRLQIYLHVVIPQVITRVLPSLAGQFASLIKDSSLLSIIAVREFTMNAQEVNAFTYSTLESYFPLAIGYLLLTFPISLLSRYLEKGTNMNLDISALTKSFDDQIVLDNIDLELKDIHSLAIIGPSGGGKTTFLRILAGLIKANSGSLTVNGKEIHFREKNLREYRKHIGMVFQAYNLFPHLTAISNIMLPLRKVHGKTKEEAEAIGRELLARFGLTEHAEKKPAELSGGQKQRVALSRAMAIKPGILMLDEPTSALDPEYTAEVLEMIETLRAEGQDQILVTHEMGFARHVSDWVLLLSDGKIVEQGRPKDIFENPKTPEAINFFEKILKY